MKHDFTDKYGNLDSPVHRLDPRAKIVAALAGIVIVVTEPLTAEVNRMALYSAPLLAVLLLSRLPVQYIIKRMLIVSPFILMASAFYFLSAIADSGNHTAEKTAQSLNGALIIFFRAFTAILILILLTSTEKFHRLLMALRRLRMPKLICSISALLYRYIFLLADETLRTTRARESRTPGKLMVNRMKVAGNQAAMIFLRSWERSQTIYKSMLSRGFTGEYPDMQRVVLRTRDVIFPCIFIALMLAIRLLV